MSVLIALSFVFSHTYPVWNVLAHRMQQFQRRSTVSKVCMEAVAHCLLPNQIRDLRTEFAKYDLRQRGEISHADLRTVLGAQTMALSEGEIQSIFEGVDIDHAGVIQYHEFLAAAMSQHMVTEENLRLAFERIGNRNECITGADLCVLLSKERSGAEVAEIEREIQSLRLEQIDFKQVGLSALIVAMTIS
jgi:Ca2+-binding EF-hand superfamily protein